jgi:recombination protein RecT
MAEITSLAQRATTVRDLVTKYIPQIAKAIPRGMDANRFARIALTMLPNSPKLLECDPKTLLGGILQAAAWGLELDPVLGMAYLVPYKDRAQIIIGYQGLITLARRSGEVKNIVPQTVYEADEFVYELGLNPRLHHVPSAKPERGNMIGFYAVARMADGSSEFRFMWKHEVDLIRSRSRAKDSGPWVTDYEPMAWKTVIRRLCKYLPRTVELAHAVTMDEKVDSGIEQNLEDSLLPAIVVEAQVEQKSGLDALADKLAGEKAPGAVPPERVNVTTGEILPPAETKEPPADKKPTPVEPEQKPQRHPRQAMPDAGAVFGDTNKREPGQEG